MRPELRYYSADLAWLNESYDFVVIGSGLTAVSFVHRLNELCDNKRILVLEAGPVMSEQHFQQEDQRTAWDNFAAAADHEIGSAVPGLVPHRVLFGGRTLFWTAWTPRPTQRELDRWPLDLANTLKGEFGEAENFLGVEYLSDSEGQNLDEPSPHADVEGYTIRRASIARKNGVKFSAAGAWHAIFDGPANNIVRVVCNARVAELLFQDERVLGVKIGEVEKVYSNTQFLICAGALENFRLGAKVATQHVKLACHGVVSHVLVGRLEEPSNGKLVMKALLARPDDETQFFDHHFQICIANLPLGWTSEEIHRFSPDVLELSPTLFETEPDANFACSITCLFEMPPLHHPDRAIQDFGITAFPTLNRLENPDGFAKALASNFAYFEMTTKRFAERFLPPYIWNSDKFHVNMTAKYVVHDTLVRSDLAYEDLTSWRSIFPAPGSNAFTLGQVNWPSVGVSNPAILNVAAAFALAKELAKI